MLRFCNIQGNDYFKEKKIDAQVVEWSDLVTQVMTAQ